jgi:RNA polymerase-binding transcription factor DksA
MELPKEFIEKQKDALQKEKERIVIEIKQLKKYPDYGDGIGEDGLQEVVDYENNIAIEEELDFVLQKINKALKAIEAGTYGKCDNCSANIEMGRLEVVPYADSCVTCEKSEK